MNNSKGSSDWKYRKKPAFKPIMLSTTSSYRSIQANQTYWEVQIHRKKNILAQK